MKYTVDTDYLELERVRAGKTITSLCEKAKVSETSYTRLLKLKYAGIKVLGRLTRALDLDPVQLIQRRKDANQEDTTTETPRHNG